MQNLNNSEINKFNILITHSTRARNKTVVADDSIILPAYRLSLLNQKILFRALKLDVISIEFCVIDKLKIKKKLKIQLNI